MNSENETKIPNSIHKLLLGKLSGGLNPSESSELEQWLSSDSNLEAAQKYLRTSDKLHALNDMYSIDQRRAWNKLKSHADKQRLRRVISIGSAAVIMIGLIIGLAISDFTLTENMQNRKLVVQTDQAPKIILADGREISLDSMSMISELDGVKINVNSSSRKLEYVNGNANANNVEVFNKIVIPTGVTYKLMLADGTSVWLNSQTELKYPTQFVGKTRNVWLTGEAYFEVKKNGKPFVVHMGDQTINVLGTAFNANNYAEGADVRVTLVNGKVTFDSKNNSYALTPGEQAVCCKKDKHVSIKSVNTKLFTSWINGEMIFQDMTLGELKSIVKRWYGIEIKFKDGDIAEYIFSGIIKQSDSPEKLMEIIARTAGLKWEISNDTTVMFSK